MTQHIAESLCNIYKNGIAIKLWSFYFSTDIHKSLLYITIIPFTTVYKRLQQLRSTLYKHCLNTIFP